MRSSILCLLLAGSLAMGVAAQQKSADQGKNPGATRTDPNAPTVATVDSFLKHMFGYDPSISWTVLGISPSIAPGVSDVAVVLKNPQGQQNVHLYVTPDGKNALVGDLMPFGADPFAPARAEIASRANGASRGPASSPVTIVEFSDLECPSCKAAQPIVDKLLADEPDVHFIFQHFPLERLHPWAFLGASYADCIGRQSNEAFWKFVEDVYANQEQITALLPQNVAPDAAMKQAEPAISKKLQEIAASAGANAQQVTTCAADPATAARIRKSLALGETLQVTGTPTLYVNGRKIQSVNGIPYEVLKSMVDAAKKEGK